MWTIHFNPILLTNRGQHCTQPKMLLIAIGNEATTKLELNSSFLLSAQHSQKLCTNVVYVEYKQHRFTKTEDDYSSHTHVTIWYKSRQVYLSPRLLFFLLFLLLPPLPTHVALYKEPLQSIVSSHTNKMK